MGIMHRDVKPHNVMIDHEVKKVTTRWLCMSRPSLGAVVCLAPGHIQRPSGVLDGVHMSTVSLCFCVLLLCCFGVLCVPIYVVVFNGVCVCLKRCQHACWLRQAMCVHGGVGVCVCDFVCDI